MKNIVLIGFMGSGKSTVADLLSKKLQRNCIETDAVVLANSQRKSIGEIFAKDGEMRFRELELEVSSHLGDRKDVVISTGGGMVINKLCIDYLKQNGVVIYLETSFEVIEKRLKGDNTRPLFSDVKKARKLFQFRKHLYEEYEDFRITTDNQTAEEITNSILKKI
ncbi:MAG: shikimate kinase [Microgenomates group bacterium]